MYFQRPTPNPPPLSYLIVLQHESAWVNARGDAY